MNDPDTTVVSSPVQDQERLTERCERLEKRWLLPPEKICPALLIVLSSLIYRLPGAGC